MMRFPGRTAIFVGALVTANTVVGLLAVLPTALLLSLLAYVGHGPYAPTSNHTYATIAGRNPPFEVDTDEAAVAGMLVVGVAMILVLIFVTANSMVIRLRPAGTAGVTVWRWAVPISSLPSVAFVVWFLGRPR